MSERTMLAPDLIKGDVKLNDNLEVTKNALIKGILNMEGELKVTPIVQATEPVIDEDGKYLFWQDSSSSPNPTYIVYRRGLGDQIKIRFDNIDPVLDSVQFNTAAALKPHSPGLLQWDASNKTLSLYVFDSDVSLQMGLEQWIFAVNNTGISIPNGKAVYVSGETTLGAAKWPTVALAKADIKSTCEGTIALSTHSVEASTLGVFTRLGAVRNMNLGTSIAGTVLYLSADAAGDLVETAPESPNCKVRMGTVIISGTLDGIFDVNIDHGGNDEGIKNFFNGAALEASDIQVASDGVNVTLTIEQSGGGDLSLFFSGDFYKLDCTPPATINLTAGTDPSPILNYVFIPESTKTLTVNDTGFPTNEAFVAVASVLVQSAASVQTDGPLKMHAWTDHLYDALLLGHLSHISEWIRAQHATYKSGVLLTPTVGAGVFDIATTSGIVYQMHKHVYPAFDTAIASSIYVVNSNTVLNRKVSNLTVELEDSLGGSLVGRYYSLVFWGVVSQDQSDCKLMCNMPSGSYSNATDAENDPNRYTDITVPDAYKNTGFLIGRVIVQHSPAGGGTWTLIKNEKLQGSLPSGTAGGAAATTTQFSDGTFRIFNNADNTKFIAMNAGNISSGATRTITMPDANIVLVDDAAVVKKANYNANTVLAANADDTPNPVTMAEQTVLARLTGGNIGAASIGIADNNIVQIDHASAADNDFAKFTTNGIEGRNYAETRSDLNLVLARYVFSANKMVTPVNANWAVNNLAPLATDSNDGSLRVRLFDDTSEEAIGLDDVWVPTGATSLRIKQLARPETAPGAARTAGWKLYKRNTMGNPSTWTSYVLNDIDITTNEDWLEDTQTETLTTLGLTAGQNYQLQFSRPAPTAGTDLTGDLAVQLIVLEFI